MERYRYRVEIQQMMFVSGATNDPPVATLSLIEDIVRSQVVEIVRQGMVIARTRGARTISVEDVMYLIRHDTTKVNRLCNYLAWKDVRKNARDQDVSSGPGDNPDILEETGDATAVDTTKKLYKKQTVAVPWKLQSMFSISFPDEEEDDSEDDNPNASDTMMERLKNADLRTQNMTKEEYVHWSECRQASFTFRKGKRFREWAGMGSLIESKLQDDIIDILGFLTFEIVGNLTEEALKVKDTTDLPEESGQTKQSSLFDRASKQQTPLQPEHVRAAYARFQGPSYRNTPLRAFSKGAYKYPVRII